MGSLDDVPAWLAPNFTIRYGQGELRCGSKSRVILDNMWIVRFRDGTLHYFTPFQFRQLFEEAA